MSHSKLKSSLLLVALLFSSFLAIFPYLMNFTPVANRQNQIPMGGPIDFRAAYNWTKAWLVSVSSTNNAYCPTVAVDDSGNMYIAWYDNSPYYDGSSNADIVYRMWNATTGNWGGFTGNTDLVSTFSSSDAYYPDVAVDGTGNVHIVWQDLTTVAGDTSGTNDIFYRYWNVTTKTWGGHIGSWDFISPNSSSTCGPPTMAVDSRGNVHVVWADLSNVYGNDTNYYDIVYRYWNATKNIWGTIELVSTESNLSAQYPTIAVDSVGNVHVAWQDSTNLIRSDGVLDIFYKFRNATTGIWRGRVNITDEVSIESTGSANNPSITIDNLGMPNIVWTDSSVIPLITDSWSDYDIFYKFWNGSRWTGHVKAIDVLTEYVTSSYSDYNPEIKSDSSGNLYAVWEQSGNYLGSGSDDDIAYRIWNSTTSTWMAPALISTESTADSAYPDIAVDTTGAMHVVWSEYISTYGYYRIYYKKTMTTPPAPTVLAPISPNPNPNFEVELSWQQRIAVSQYYIYRNTSFISSVVGLTPIATVVGLNYTDTVTQNGTFYYVIVGANLMGNSSISNCQSVTMLLFKGQQRITIASNADFAKYASEGNGTASNPWIIEKYYINGTNRNCISVSDTTNYFIIRNSTVFSGDRGVYLKNVQNGKLINITARFNKVGFHLNGGQKNQLITSIAHNNTGSTIMTGIGFLLYQSNSNFLSGNKAFKNVALKGPGKQDYGGLGFLLYTAHSNTLINNDAYYNVNYNSSGTDGHGSYYAGSGFQILGANYNNLTRNTAYSNWGGYIYEGMGIFLNGAGNVLQENIIHDHRSGEADGIYLRNTGGNNKILNNTLYQNAMYGLEIVGGSTETVNYNKIYSNGYGGAYLWGPGFTVHKNTVWNNSVGFDFTAASNYLISNNTISSSIIGVDTTNAHALKFYNNTVYKNVNGIDILNADGCSFIDNQVFNNTGRGITGYENNTLYLRNTIYGNNIGIYVGTTSTSVSSTANINITQNLITNNREGIHILKGYNVEIRYNRIYNNTAQSIYLDRSNSSSITWNDMLDNGNFTKQVNCKNNIIQSNAYFRGTTLYPITPNPVLDGWVWLNWQNVPWATYYLAYRKYNAPIPYFFSLASMTPVLNVTGPPAVDNTIPVLGNYYYVIVAGNATCWTSISDNQWVNVSAYPKPAIPVLDAIVPSISYNGQIKLEWNDAQNATRYYVYKHTSPITTGNIGSLSPIAKVTLSTYTDIAFINGTFHYAIVAGNSGFNSSVSNDESVLIQRQSIPPTPSLSLIVPYPDYDGVIKLDWADTVSTTKYYIYRDTALITVLTGRIPYATVTQSNYTDNIAVNNTFYYVVVAGNLGFNSSMSVCRNVTTILYPIPNQPVLSQIIPGTDYYGLIQLNWTDSVNTAKYYVYRDIAFISTVNSLTPIATIFQSDYTDIVVANETFYYVIVASNPSHNSSISNCRSVTVILYSVPDIPILNPIQPNPDYDGTIHFNWTSAASASKYYIYREMTPIDDLTLLHPIAVVTTTSYTDTLSVNGTYHYAVRAGNPGYNASQGSNDQWVEVLIVPPPGTPFLEPIPPSYNGTIRLNWNDTINTAKYYLYKDTSPITTVTSRTPYAVVTQSDYTDLSVTNGTFFYVIVAGNSVHNSSISNCQSVLVAIYSPPSTPTLSPIVPSLNTYGIITLNWSDTINTVQYYVYKSNSLISELGALRPIATVPQSIYTYSEQIDGIYYYVVVAGNPSYNSSISNCANVTIELYNPPATPILSPISPNLDYDGTVQLDWTDAINATKYYIFRDISKITSITGRVPIAVVPQSSYTNVLFINNTFHYVIVAGNAKFNSSISNCENVTIERYPVPSQPTLYAILPGVDYDGNIILDWSDTASTIRYYVYKDIVNIDSVISRVPIAVVYQSSYIDFSPINDTFYYVIMAGNLGFNSSISICRSVIIEIYPPPTIPFLNPIVPSVSYDGVLHLSWTNSGNTIKYYIYREQFLITNATLLTPKFIVTMPEYTEVILINQTYYYCIVAANPSHNSSMSNVRSATIAIYSVPPRPTLSLIVPSIDYDGTIRLDWSDTSSTSRYYVYREVFFITDVTLLIPKFVVTLSEYADTVTSNQTYYYVVIAGNPSYNSTASDCRNVIVTIYSPPSTPSLQQITPAISYNGKIQLEWTDTVSTSRYYIYRSMTNITSVSSLSPIAVVSQSDYLDVTNVNATFFYVVVAGNPTYNSTISQCWSVTVQLSGPSTPPGDNTWLIIVIVIGACAVAAALVVVKVRRKPQRAQLPTQQLTGTKAGLKGVKAEWKENLAIEDKIRALQRNVISIEELAELADTELSSYFTQNFTPLPIKLIEFLQRLDAPMEDKVEIITEFNNLSEEQKEEYLKELSEL